MNFKNVAAVILIAVVFFTVVSCNKRVAPDSHAVNTEAQQAGQTHVGPKIAVGESYCGGIIFYVDTTGKHGLIAPGRQVLYAKWGCFGTSVENTKSDFGSGQANTNAIVNACPETNCAAKVCDNLVLNGYDDWFLPSKDELDSLYAKKALFKDFKTNYYWSSTQVDGKSAQCQDFYDGHKLHYGKQNSYYFRAIRAF